MPRNSATFTSKVIGFLCVSHRFVFGDVVIALNMVTIKLSKLLCLEPKFSIRGAMGCYVPFVRVMKNIMIGMISIFDMVEQCPYGRFMICLSVYFTIRTSKNLQKSSAIQNNSITLSSVIVAIIVCKYLCFSTINMQWFSLITKFTDVYDSSNSY